MHKNNSRKKFSGGKIIKVLRKVIVYALRYQKNLFDLFPVDTIKDKPVGIIITSGSNNHYLVAEYQLVPILNYLKADVINKYVYVTQEDFGVNTIVNEGIDIRLETLASELEARAKRYQELLASYDF